METVVLLALVALVLINVALVAVLLKRRPSDGLVVLESRLGELTRTLDARLESNSRNVHDATAKQWSESRELIESTRAEMMKHLTEVTKAVAETGESSKQVFTMAEQLKNLERVLTHQKQRGTLGEEGLKLILDNMLPATTYELQYRFNDGEVVDAIIKTKEGFVPVDAKFSLDNYNRLANAAQGEREVLEREFRNDLKKRVDETAKYIRPKEGTLPFAFMFIPAEGVFYDLLVKRVGGANERLIEYAYREKHVVVVSPTTFAAYLQTVLYGFRMFQIEESAREYGKRVGELGKHLEAYDKHFKSVGKSLNATVNHYNSAQHQFRQIDKDVLRITGSAPGFESLAMEAIGESGTERAGDTNGTAT